MILPAAIALLALAAAPAAAEESVGYAQVFVDAFAEACVPERLSYPGTQAHAESLGWTAVETSAHPELDAMMAKSAEGAAEAAEEMQGTFDVRIYARAVAEVPHYLIVSRTTFVIGEAHDPLNPWVYLGCYLYNFDATAPIDPAPMTALVEKPISHSVDQDGIVSHVWGPPCPMPRTGDSYLTYIAPDSPAADQTGFSGLMVKFETSEPDEGEVVPETYCTEDAPSAES